MGKDKKLEDTVDLDAKAIRRASSKPGSRKTSAKKSEYSKGGSARKKERASSQKKTTSKPQQKPKPAQKKPASSSVKQSSQHKTASENGKIRHFPKEEKQNSSSKKSNAKRKKAIKKIKSIAVFALACILVLSGVVVFAVSQLYKIKTITVNYDLNKTSQSEKVKRKYTDEQVINASGVHLGENLVYLKLAREDKLISSVNSNLPYLSVESVEEKGFSNLILNVKQIKPEYAFMFDGTYVLTDEMMNVIDVTQDKEVQKQYTIIRYAKVTSFEKGSKIMFDENESGSGLGVTELFDAIKESGLEKLTYISLKNMNDLYMTYDNRILIHVGKTDNISEKLKLAAKSLAQEDKNNPDQKGELNLTIDKKAYFTPQ